MSPVSDSPQTEDARAAAPKLEIVGRAGAAAAPPAAVESAKPKKGNALRKLVLTLVTAAALGGGGWYGHQWWVDGRFLVTTDDAYVSADMAILTPKVTGYIQSVPVRENQAVKAGDAIVTIDPGDYELALRSAEAKIEAQQASVARIHAQRDAAVQGVAEAEASRAVAQATADQAALDLGRVENLVRSGTTAQAPLDQARSAKAEADARLAGADASLSSARASVSVADAQIREAESELPGLVVDRDQAQRDLGFTTLRAASTCVL